MDEQKQQGWFWSDLGLLQSKNDSDCNKSGLFKNTDLLLLIKEKNNSNQTSLLIGPIGFLSSPKLIYPVSLLERLGSFWFLKTFKINHGLMTLVTVFLSIWSTCSLVSAKKECFFILFFFYGNICWRSFLVLSHYLITDSSHIALLTFKIRHNWTYKSFERHKLCFKQLRHPFLEEVNWSFFICL